MSVKIRLKRFGTKMRPFYRIVVMDSRVPRDGVCLAEIGLYHPIEKAEKQMIQIGRQRGGKLYQWLLEIDLALKGSHSTPDRARFKLEQLILRLAPQVGPQAARR